MEEKYYERMFSELTIRRAVNTIKRQSWIRYVDWITCIPSNRENVQELVPNLTSGVAEELNKPFVKAVRNNGSKGLKIQKNACAEGKWNNLDGVYEINNVQKGTCLLVDDIFGSGVTIAVASRKLLEAGAEGVIAFTLLTNK